MSDGGSIVNLVPVVRDGERVEVVVSGDRVEIGGWNFGREDLIFALGVKEESEGPPPP